MDSIKEDFMICFIALVPNNNNITGSSPGYKQCVILYLLQIWVDDTACRGSESSLTLCRMSQWGNHNCMHNEDAAAVCRRKT